MLRVHASINPMEFCRMAVIGPLMLDSNVVSHALMHFDYRPQKRERAAEVTALP